MSLILDALNRSREDSTEVPGLATRHAYPEQQPDRRLLYLSILLLCAMVVIAWLAWDKRDSEQSVRDATEPVAKAPAAVAPSQPNAATAEQAAAAKPPMDTTEPAVAVIPATTVSNDAAAGATAGPDTATASEPEPSPEVAPEIEALYQPADSAPDASPAAALPASPAPAPRAAAAPQELDVDIEQLVREAEGALEDARLAEHPAPFINDLSQQVKDGIPTVYYQRHEYSGRAEQSRVVLNGKALAKGGSPATGMRVEEILPDSVVLNHQGTQFRLRALNSWVNL
jgi:hypothetical protein